MTTSLFKDTVRTIKKNFGRYISILLIVCLGTAFFVGIKATAPDMFYNAQEYFTGQNLFDIRIRSTIGLTDDDLKEISKIDGVEYISGEKFVDALVSVNGENEIDIDGTQISARAYSIDPVDISNLMNGMNDGNYINRVQLIEGRYPQAAGECLVDDSVLSTPDSYTIGSVITLTNGGGEIPSELTVAEFTIVGIIRSPYYISFERGNTDIGSGKIGTFIVIPLEAFSTDYYTEAYLKISGSDNYEAFSSGYGNFISPFISKIENSSDTLIKKRVKVLKPQLLEKIADAQNNIDVKSMQAEEKIDELDETINSLRDLAENGPEMIKKAEDEFNQKFSSAEQTINNNTAKWNAAINDYNAKKEELARKQLEYNDNYEKWSQSKALYDELKPQYDSAYSAVEQLSNQISATRSLISAAEEMLQKIEDMQVEAYSTEQIQSVVNSMQTMYPELYNSVKSLTTQGLAAEIITNLRPYLSEEKAKLTEQEREIKEKQAVLETLKTSLEEKNTALANASSSLASAKSGLENAQKQLDDYYQELQQAGFDIQTGSVEFEIEKLKAQTALKELKDQVSAAQTNLELATTKKEEAEIQLNESLSFAKTQLNDAKTLYSKLDSVKWSIYDRDDTPGYAGYGQTVKNIEILSDIFPVFFFIVSTLVCLTTITRLVEEDRTLLGTYCALGYSVTSVVFKYLFYSLSACLLGAAAGICSGIYLFPKIITDAYSVMYSLPHIVYRIPIADTAVSIVISVFLNSAVTVAAVMYELRLVPAVLMRPKAPKSGKRIVLEKITFFWKKIGFQTKVTVRNLFRNKTRYIMTMLGIAGSCALLLASMGFYNSLSDITKLQYGRNAITKYDFQIVFDTEQSAGSYSTEYKTILANSRIEDMQLVSFKSMSIVSDNKGGTDVYVFVPEKPGDIGEFIDIRFDSKHPLELNQEGAVITKMLAERYHLSQGDEISFSDANGNVYSVNIASVAENYAFNYIYMTPSVYEKTTGEKPVFSYAVGTISESIKGLPDDEFSNAKGLLVTDIMKTDGVTTVSFTTDTTESIGEVTKALSWIVVVFFVTALVLAFVVLFNLSNINIIERTKELATLKVLGFTEKEVNNYIFRENFIVSFFGIVFGVGLGVALHRVLISFTAVDTVMYGQNIAWYSYITAVAITVFFIVSVNLILRKKIRDINMAQALKSVE